MRRSFPAARENQKFETVDLFFEKPTNVSIDGEIVQFCDLHISVARNALRILIPSGSKMIGSWSGHVAVPAEELSV